MVHYGPIPRGMFILHRCDVMLCVRPDHLFLGTQGDNMRDKTQKQRQVGTKLGNAILNNELVRYIRIRSALNRSYHGMNSIPGIARDLQVSAASVSGVVRKKTWTHVK
jgi:hypothetical protein